MATGTNDLVGINDVRLKMVIDFLREKWKDPKTGLVASGIFDPPHPPLFATSQLIQEGKWIHAERNALQQFFKIHNHPGPHAEIVVTLSPCVKEISESRMGRPCVDLLSRYKIGHVYAGIMDSSPKNSNLEEYKNFGLEISLSEDNYCKQVCKNLLEIFKEYGNKVNSDLPAIKDRIGYRVFNSG